MKRIVAFILVTLALIGAWIVVAPFLATYLIVEKPLEHADAMIVLSGSAVYKERTRKAAELFRQGVAPRIFITDDGGRSGWSQSEKTHLPFVELERRELIANGVPPDSVTILPYEVSGTEYEARELADELAERPLGSVLIVTSAYHTRRALRTFEKILARSNTEIGIVGVPPGNQTPSSNYWWLKARGWQMVGGEYVKSGVYYAYY